jgi:rare lipoprotein A
MSGEASYYDNSSIDPRWGGITKGGQKFDENKMTAAVSPSMWKKLKGKKARVVANGREVIVDINDTGGFDKYNRVMDLSKGAFKKLFGSTKQGTGNVTVYPWER